MCGFWQLKEVFRSLEAAEGVETAWAGRAPAPAAGDTPVPITLTSTFP